MRECWSLYRNNKALDLPDVNSDDAEKIIAKVAQFRTENLVVHEPMRKAVMGEK